MPRGLWINAAFLLLPCVVGVTTVPADAEQLRLKRGEQLRQVLLRALDYSYQHNGVWPQRLDEQGAAGLIYTNPGHIRDSWSDLETAAVSVVLRESSQSHQDGVWLGYGDGHLEFAPDAATLAQCQTQVSILRDGLVHQAVAAKTAVNASGRLRLRILDSEGKPLAGSAIGVWGQFTDNPPNAAPAYFTVDGKDETPTTDKRGEATVEASQVFASRFRIADEPIARLYVVNVQRQLAAIADVRKSEFGTDRSREIRLLPACKISGELTCLGNRDPLRFHVSAVAFTPGQEPLRALFSEFKRPVFEFLFPPGDFGIIIQMTNAYPVRRYLRIEPGQRELKLQLNLEPVEFASLIGNPAPEFRAIKGWKNGGPVTLAALKGKLVLLDFWGYWCGPCNGSMPALMKLHDEFKDKGLVIIAVHDDSVASIAEMEEKLVSVRKTVWGGRDLPFLVALDDGGLTRIRHSFLDARGATTAEYGICSFPTTLIVDRQGRLIGSLEDVRAPGTRERVEQLLNLNGAPK